jgi:cell division septum initiation protein DivIVA
MFTPVSKYQLLVDLAGEFGTQFARLDTPCTEMAYEIGALCRCVHDVQRDLTIRRCLVDDRRMQHLHAQCAALSSRHTQLTTLVKELTPSMQQLWQETLDRCARQQHLFKERVALTAQLRSDLKDVSAACAQLMPFVAALTTAAHTIDTRRTGADAPIALMDQLIKQIDELHPDSEARCDAIAISEREYKQARAQREHANSSTIKLRTAKEQLKPTQTPIAVVVMADAAAARRSVVQRASFVDSVPSRERSTTNINSGFESHRAAQPRPDQMFKRHSTALPDDGSVSSLEDSLERMQLAIVCTSTSSSRSQSRQEHTHGSPDHTRRAQPKRSNTMASGQLAVPITVDSDKQSAVSPTRADAIDRPKMSSSLPKERSMPTGDVPTPVVAKVTAVVQPQRPL